MPIHIIFLSQTMQRSLALAQKTVTLEEGLLKVLVQIYSSKKNRYPSATAKNSKVNSINRKTFIFNTNTN